MFLTTQYLDEAEQLADRIAILHKRRIIANGTLEELKKLFPPAKTASVFSYPLIFLPFISSAFVPTETMPSVVRAFAENQPVTSIVETIRALLSSQPVGNDIWVALAWCLGTLIIAYLFAVRAYKRKAA